MSMMSVGPSYVSFQSTRPVWGATPPHVKQIVPSRLQSTRPVWGATAAVLRLQLARDTSIHAPRVGRDFAAHLPPSFRPPLQSTRPVWGATARTHARGGARRLISIHAPRVGRDHQRCLTSQRRTHFNPRAPCGARPEPRAAKFDRQPRFQSTRPVWGATRRDDYLCQQCLISIHAPRVGRDHQPPPLSIACLYFNPRAPCGARPMSSVFTLKWRKFQSTRPVWGATGRVLCWCRRGKYFNPRAPCGARHQYLGESKKAKYFNPRAPCGARRQI